MSIYASDSCRFIYGFCIGRNDGQEPFSVQDLRTHLHRASPAFHKAKPTCVRKNRNASQGRLCRQLRISQPLDSTGDANLTAGKSRL